MPHGIVALYFHTCGFHILVGAIPQIAQPRQLCMQLCERCDGCAECLNASESCAVSLVQTGSGETRSSISRKVCLECLHVFATQRGATITAHEPIPSRDITAFL